jgi:hypothetical protein
MTNLDYYLTCDHDARARTTLLSVIVGIAASAVAAQFDVPPRTVGIVCVMAVGIVEVARAQRYVQPRERKRITVDSPSAIRRSLILAPVSVLIFVAVSLLPIPRIEAAIIERKLKENADDPLNQQNIRDTTRALIHAETGKIKLQPSVVEHTGRRFIEASVENPHAWETAQQYLDYRSFLNASFVPSPSKLTVWKDSRYQANVNIKPNPVPSEHLPVRAFSVFFAGGYVSPQNSARLESFGNPQSESSGIGVFVIDGGADIVGLDGTYMKNVIIRNSEVEYDGGPVSLENVSFVNCKFHFQRTPLAIDLGKSILMSAMVSFTTRTLRTPLEDGIIGYADPDSRDRNHKTSSVAL